MIMKSRFFPHLAFLLLTIAVVAFSYITNQPRIAAFAAASLTDPLILLAGVVTGATLTKSQYLLSALAVLAVILSLVIAQINADWLGEFRFSALAVFARFLALGIIAFITNAVRLCFSRGADSD